MPAPDAPVLGTPNAGTTGSVTYPWPTHQADDILMLATETNITGGLTAPSGMSNTVSSPRAQGSLTTINAFWKRATSSAEADPSVVGTSDHQVGIPFRIRGGLVSGNPWTASTAGGQSSGTARTFSGFNTVAADCLVVYMVTSDLDTLTDNFGSINTPSGLTGFTVLDQNFTDGGNGGGLMVAYGTKATAGFVGNLTWTFVSASLWSGIALAFPPATIGGTVEFEGWGSPL